MGRAKRKRKAAMARKQTRRWIKDMMKPFEPPDHLKHLDHVCGTCGHVFWKGVGEPPEEEVIDLGNGATLRSKHQVTVGMVG